MAEMSTTAYIPHKPQPYTPAFYPHRAKSQWPPDFSKLNPKHQFRFERRYKRRTQLKWARPRFMAWTRIAQWVGCIGIGVYGVFFMDWGREMRAPGQVGSGPFERPRQWLKDLTQDLQGIRNPSSESVDKGRSSS